MGRACSQADDSDIAQLSNALEQHTDMDFSAASRMNRKRVLSSSSSNSEDAAENNGEKKPVAKCLRFYSDDDIDLESIETNGKASSIEKNSAKANAIQPKPIMATAIHKETATADTVEQHNLAEIEKC
ncbi:hypothetical protein ElyMa_001653200 [Elysia marginata]|uniref:Uncharacterized protein n=1 Tax=Elysia marginata TaxID=1093978 RepID=A0AAV4JNV1_9GAST|nr:hypothetical protein ElyMa_001653200 [Elysia marginata]